MKNRLLGLFASRRLLTAACMSDILFIKTSSLGDVIHHMPAVTEARRHRPQARIAWVVEEAFAPLVRLHPAVDRSSRSRRGAGARAPFSARDLARDRRVPARDARRSRTRR